MAWTTPKTDFAAGNVLTAAQMNAIGANLNAIGGTWTPYTPTWTNLTVGNASQDTRYIAAGKLIIVNLKITLGSTSSVGTIPEFSLPVNLDNSYMSGDTIGALQLQDVSTGSVYWGKALPRTALTGARPFYDSISGTASVPGVVNATLPFSWAAGDVISGTLMYESA